MNLKLSPRHFQILRQVIDRKRRSRKVACPFCGSRQSDLVFRSPNVRTPVFRWYFSEKIVRCASCSFVFTNPRLSTEDLEEYYTRAFKLEGLDVPGSKEEFLGDGCGAIWFSKERDLNLVLRHRSAGTLLDVGCATGSLLYLARERGFQVKGVEVSKASAAFARGKLGLDVFNGQLEEAGFRAGEFDVVTSFHSLEHVPDPRALLAEVRRILRDDGLFIVVVPNFDGWSSREMQADWRWLQPVNHYSHFTPGFLKAQLERLGFQCEMYTEEGRYGDEELAARHGPEERARLQAQLRGSEIVATVRKGSGGPG